MTAWWIWYPEKSMRTVFIVNLAVFRLKIALFFVFPNV
jgi:hypothetical protein